MGGDLEKGSSLKGSLFGTGKKPNVEEKGFSVCVDGQVLGAQEVTNGFPFIQF